MVDNPTTVGIMGHMNTDTTTPEEGTMNTTTTPTPCPVAPGDVVRFFSDSDEVVVADPAPRFVRSGGFANLAGWVGTLERVTDGARRTVRVDQFRRGGDNILREVRGA